MIRKIISERVVGGQMPKYLYHGTSSKNAVSVLRDGLAAHGVEKAWDESADKVYLTSSYETAFNWGWKVDEDNVIVLKINTKYIDKEKLDRDWNAEGDGMMGTPEPSWGDIDWDNLEGENFEYDGDIPADAIEIIDCSRACADLNWYRKNTVRVKWIHTMIDFLYNNYERILDAHLPGSDVPLLAPKMGYEFWLHFIEGEYMGSAEGISRLMDHKLPNGKLFYEYFVGSGNNKKAKERYSDLISMLKEDSVGSRSKFYSWLKDNI